MRFILILFIFLSFNLKNRAQTPDDIFFSFIKKDSIAWPEVELERNEKFILNILKTDPSVAACHGRDQSSWKANLELRVKDFHVLDLNKDSLPDLIDENTCYGSFRTVIFLKTRTGNFKKIWDRPGRIVELAINDKTSISFRKPACCCDNTHEFYRFSIGKNEQSLSNNFTTFWHFDADMIDTPQLKRFFKTKKAALLRAKPVMNDTLKPYECREEVKIKGNQIGEYAEGTDVKILAEYNDARKKKWYFIMIPPTKFVAPRKDYLIFNDGKNYVFGWMQDKDLKR